MPEVLRTPSGRIELAPPPLLADLPRALADLDTPTPALVVIGRRDVRSNNSWMHNLPTLAKGLFRGTALVHPQDAAEHGLTEGTRVRLGSAHGSIEVTATLSDSLMPGVISLPHGWGHDLPGAQLGVAAQHAGANLNALLDDAARDPLSGNAVLSGVAVTLAPLQCSFPRCAAHKTASLPPWRRCKSSRCHAASLWFAPRQDDKSIGFLKCRTA